MAAVLKLGEYQSMDLWGTTRRIFVISFISTLLVLSVVSFAFRLELYPFAPYQMYSYSYAGDVTIDEVFVTLNDGRSSSVARLCNMDEATLLELLKFRPGTERATLVELLQTCRSGNAELISADGESLRFADIERVQFERSTWHQLSPQNRAHPDQRKVIAEVVRESL